MCLVACLPVCLLTCLLAGSQGACECYHAGAAGGHGDGCHGYPGRRHQAVQEPQSHGQHCQQAAGQEP